MILARGPRNSKVLKSALLCSLAINGPEPRCQQEPAALLAQVLRAKGLLQRPINRGRARLHQPSIGQSEVAAPHKRRRAAPRGER